MKEDSLEKQNSNIIPSNFQKILNFQIKKPTIAWKKVRNENYNELEEDEKTVDEVVSYYKNEYSFINKMDKILSDYLNTISKATKDADAKNIYYSTKDTVLKINNVNREHLSIHTGQREDLCQFFEDVVESTGFNLKDAGFISKRQSFIYRWREW